MLLRISDSCACTIATEPWPLLVFSGEKYCLLGPGPPCPGAVFGVAADGAGRAGGCMQLTGVWGAGGSACIMTMDCLMEVP